MIASAVTDDGDQIYPRNWHHEFVQLPVVDKELQQRPTITQNELNAIVQITNERHRVLFALLAGTGLRIGEALALQVSDITSDCRIVNIRRSIWRGKLQNPKSTNAFRVIDIAEPLAQILREYIIGRSGLLFPSRKGTPLDQRNLLDALHSVHKGNGGFHVFRRFRAAVLRKAQVPEDLIGFWLGHARSLTDRYASQLRDDVDYRQEWCERAGLGFEIGYLGYKNATQIDLVKAA